MLYSGDLCSEDHRPDIPNEQTAISSALGAKSFRPAACPMYIAGKRTVAGEKTVVDMTSGEQVSIATLTRDLVDKVARPSADLRSLPLDEIIAFLHNVGQNWKRRDYVRRTVYERNLVRFLGLSPQAARHEADWIALCCRPAPGSTMCWQPNLAALMSSTVGAPG